MNKIPTVFKRDPEDMRRLLPEVHDDCAWVLAGEGVGTRKYDGTCCMFDGTAWWARREVKPGKTAPEGWVEVEHDENTGKRVGWEPVEQSGFAKWHAEALMHWESMRATVPAVAAPESGTYELIGPKVNGNPEHAAVHVLMPHQHAEIVLGSGAGNYTFEELREIVVHFGQTGAEGIVWHHPDGRMAKLKARDFKFDKVPA